MLNRTKITLAAAAVMLALAAPAMAGEGSPDITDNWNTPRGYSGPMYGDSWAPGTAYVVPDDDDGYVTGYSSRSMLDDDVDDDLDD